mmetsp:Transcript_103209/g.301020  ORF Transcript_103209/g.301020 Transcript_103209/m.301020 type:complete len:176 (-) Transcript_103209:461-988(-)
MGSRLAVNTPRDTVCHLVKVGNVLLERDAAWVPATSVSTDDVAQEAQISRASLIKGLQILEEFLKKTNGQVEDKDVHQAAAALLANPFVMDHMLTKIRFPRVRCFAADLARNHELWRSEALALYTPGSGPGSFWFAATQCKPMYGRVQRAAKEKDWHAFCPATLAYIEQLQAKAS